MVSVVRICGHQLHAELGIRRICSGRILGRSFSIDDSAAKVTCDRSPAWPKVITHCIAASASVLWVSQFHKNSADIKPNGDSA
jgi:hypothetical protein